VNEVKKISKYIYLLYVAFCIIGLIIFGKVLYIQATPSEEAKKLAEKFTYKVNEILPERGRILSADGELLATSIPEYEIRWDSQDNYNKEIFQSKLDSLCAGLALIITNKTPEVIKSEFLEAINSKNRYLKIADHLNYNQLQEFKRLPFVNRKKARNGFIVITKNKRVKPFGDLAFRTIGLFRDSNMVGIELAYDSILRGRAGKQMQERIAGDVWKPMTDDFIEEPEPGLDVVTSLDVHLQDAAQSSLRKTMEFHKAEWGCVVLMEVKTGYIKAMANLSYNQKSNTYTENENYAVYRNIEPGSTMKLASLLACIEAGKLELNKTVDAGDGKLTIANHTLEDVTHGRSTGVVSIEQIFAKSSNVGTALIVREVFGSNPQEYLNYLMKFGYGEQSGIDLSNEPKGKVRSSVKGSNWSALSLTQMAIGYEVEVTPLQQLAFYNAIANDGMYMKPQLVKELRRNNSVVKKFDPVVLRQNFLSPSTIQKGRKLMEAVASIGTAKRVFVNSPYKAAGKTGTARIFENGIYLDSAHRASFVGYFPAESPKYSCIVVINRAQTSEAFGGKIAAPVFRDLANILFGTELDIAHTNQIADSLFVAQTWRPRFLLSKTDRTKRYLSFFGLPYQVNTKNSWSSLFFDQNGFQSQGKEFSQSQIPDVRGMGLSDALFVLEKRGLKVVVKGKGRVFQQSILPGTKANRQNIIIELK
jgi:cell division protein FtsI (penicillin-binding protein 3)